eukprot:1147322-Pelagomonas_calceolata.AAC.9
MQKHEHEEHEHVSPADAEEHGCQFIVLHGSCVQKHRHKVHESSTRHAIFNPVVEARLPSNGPGTLQACCRSCQGCIGCRKNTKCCA